MWIGRSVVVVMSVLFAAGFGAGRTSSARHSHAAGWMAAGGDKKPSSEMAAIAKLRDEWAKDLHEKRLDPIVMLYAPDAVFLVPTGERIAGRPAIRELCRKVMETVTSNISMRSVVAEYSGDLAYDSGEFSETLVSMADGTKSESHGNYLMVLKRQADGRWLIVEQVWTGAPAAGQGPPSH